MSPNYTRIHIKKANNIYFGRFLQESKCIRKTKNEKNETLTHFIGILE